MGLWQTHDPPRTPAQTPTCPGENAARARSRTDQARESREEAHPGYQEECEEWADGGLQDPGQGSGSDEKVRLTVFIWLSVAA